MNALLEVPAIRHRVFPISVELYQKFTEGLKTELLRGVILQKGSKSPLHCKLVERLRRILSAQVEPTWLVFQGSPLATTDSEPEPDLLIVAGPMERYDLVHPVTAELVIELAVSSLEIDRVKAGIYAEAGILEYWIVCPERRCVEIYRRPEGGEFAEKTVLMAPALLESARLAVVKVKLEELFA